MSAQDNKLHKLRDIINENLRTQLDNDKVNYISTGHTLGDVAAKQSHCIFARRGCGKTLLLHHSRRALAKDIKAIYINCEDFKHHSFPNVLIELLEAATAVSASSSGCHT
jgi:predicted AAA+ superfamily ATPase